MILEDVWLQKVKLYGMGQIWKYRWNVATPWPAIPTPERRGWSVNGHFLIDMEDGNDAVNLPFGQLYSFAVLPALEQIADALLPIVQQIVLSKEQPLQAIFGGLYVLRIDMVHWAAKPDVPDRFKVHPWGLNVNYARFTNAGELASGYNDNAMWERNPQKPEELIETHRGIVDMTTAAEFRDDMAQMWAVFTATAVQQERARLGI